MAGQRAATRRTFLYTQKVPKASLRGHRRRPRASTPPTGTAGDPKNSRRERCLGDPRSRGVESPSEDAEVDEGWALLRAVTGERLSVTPIPAPPDPALLDVLGAPKSRLVLSGDLGRPVTPLLRDPFTRWERPVDLVLMESTYGAREHGCGQAAPSAAPRRSSST